MGLKYYSSNGALQIALIRFGEGVGYDVRVISPRATVSDFGEVMEKVATEDRIARLRNPGKDSCLGCPRCCRERIPLTSIDALRLGTGEGRAGPRSAGVTPAARRTLLAAVRRYGWVRVWGRAVDISLRLQEDGYCVFLDRQRARCRIYPWRPLACRTYICAPCSSRVMQVRQLVINRGQDELVRLILEEAGVSGFPVNEADDFDVRPEDWRVNGFTGKLDYGEVRLRDLVSARMWRALRRVVS
jgi:Fe-S-cluster containining protein